MSWRTGLLSGYEVENALPLEPRGEGIERDELFLEDSELTWT
jgi:hypothetical protein